MKRNIHTTAFAILIAATAINAAPQTTSGTAPQEQAAPSASAASNGRSVPDPNRQLKHLTRYLQLTADQRSQLLPILQQQDNQIQAVRSDTTLTQEDRHARLRTIRQDSRTQVQAVLNDTQKVQFDQLQQNARARARQKRNQATNAPAGI
jgi:periplasmic protein CpxP/Spy